MVNKVCMTAPPLWKVCLTAPKDRAPDIAALLELTPPPPQAVLTAENPFAPETIVEAIYDSPPDAAFLSELTGFEVLAAPLPDQDWVKASQQGLPPVRAGRFFVYGAHDAGAVPHGVIPIRVEAGMAFGTGHHETTSLCLAALSDPSCRREGARRPRSVLDLGCGSGVLAIAAAKLWRCKVLATDIDPTAIDVTRANARANAVAPFIRTAIADGMDHPLIRTRAPFDLILANILAGPLTRLAPAIATALMPGGVAILSGLLRNQENLVLSFTRQLGLRTCARRRQGPWSALVLERTKPRL